MSKYMFPEYEYMEIWELSELEDSGIETENEDKHKHTSNDNDILVLGLWYPACKNGKGEEQTDFLEKILYINREPESNPVSNSGNNDRVYHIGPYPPLQNITITDNENKYEINIYNHHSLRVFLWPISCWRMFTYQAFRLKNQRSRNFQQLRPGTNWSGAMNTVATTVTIIPNNKKQPNPDVFPTSCTWLEIAFRSGRRRPSSWHKHSKLTQQQQQSCRLSTTEERSRSPGGYLSRTTSLGGGETNTGINCAPTGKPCTRAKSTV